MRTNYTFLKILLGITCGFIAGLMSAVAQRYLQVDIQGVYQWGIAWLALAYFLAKLGRGAGISAAIGALFLIFAVFGYFWTLNLLGAHTAAADAVDFKLFSRYGITAAITGGAMGLLGSLGGVKSASGCVARSLIASVFLAMALHRLFNLVQYADKYGYIGLLLAIAVGLHAAAYGKYAAAVRSLFATLALAVLWLLLNGLSFLFTGLI